MKAKILILISIWLFISAKLFSLEITNNAAVIKITQGTFVKVVDGYFENTEDGTVILEHNTSVKVDKDVKNFGNIILRNSLEINKPFIEIKQNFINNGSTLIYPFSIIYVWGNIINSGSIYNAHLIEIGQ
ncbi:MAG TPA: hypothetical protein PKY56_10430 [Candidatus Kapabacteria bacterium]|nr:hypothetical protein [Candidatus Kapabacteria bacterium]HPO63621.1 hypothetical protein [Candidatus Kapabacteria bacterium]